MSYRFAIVAALVTIVVLLALVLPWLLSGSETEERPGASAQQRSTRNDASIRSEQSSDAPAVREERRSQPAASAGGGSETRDQTRQPPTSSAKLYTIVPNPELSGRLGRLIVSFPQEDQADSTPITVWLASDMDKSVKSGYGPFTADLLPETYAVSISGKVLGDVKVEARSDTRIELGVLRTQMGEQTHFRVLDADNKTELTSGYGKRSIGLPAGTYHVEVNGVADAVTIEAGKVADF